MKPLHPLLASSADSTRYALTLKAGLTLLVTGIFEYYGLNPDEALIGQIVFVLIQITSLIFFVLGIRRKIYIHTAKKD